LDADLWNDRIHAGLRRPIVPVDHQVEREVSGRSVILPETTAAVTGGAMFDVFGYLIKGFVLLWISIIATIPNVFMGGLALCVAATVLTYFYRKAKAQK
jgi:hypothetical protein